MTQINPYLGFSGNCEEAFNFYKEAFGGEFQMCQRFKDAPTEAQIKTTKENENQILHIALPIGDGTTTLMGSDTPEGMEEPKPGSNISLSVQVDSEEEANNLFKKLSEEGTITMPLAKAFWNAYFGMCIDKYGITWMVSHDYEDKTMILAEAKNPIVHFEIPAEDTERAQTFYTKTFGWNIEEMDMPATSSTGGEPYYIVRTAKTDKNHMVQTKGAINGGMMKKANEQHTFMNYISVESIEETLPNIKTNGGTILMPKTEIAPGMGWIASFTDTEGNLIGLHQLATKE